MTPSRLRRARRKTDSSEIKCCNEQQAGVRQNPPPRRMTKQGRLVSAKAVQSCDQLFQNNNNDTCLTPFSGGGGKKLIQIVPL